MKEKYTKDQLIKQLIISHGRVCSLTTGVKDALHQINETNVLHTMELTNNTQAIKSMTKVSKAILTFIGGVFILLIIALIVLAGAEKTFNYWPTIISAFNPLK